MQNRYPGVKHFERSERHIFFGRDQDVENLTELILLEQIVVLFGKSGYGKSSLLNAGVIPYFNDLREDKPSEFISIPIRFGNYIENGNQPTLTQKFQEKVQDTLGPPVNTHLVGKVPESNTIWNKFKRYQLGGRSRFLLVLDQFEEFFTYPAKQQEDLKQQLAELLFMPIPNYMRDLADGLSDAEYDQLREEMDIKIVIAIRSDRLSLLDQLKKAIPPILQQRYEIQPLQEEQARQAIVSPALLASTPTVSFASPRFTFVPEAVSLILNSLKGDNHESSRGIESFQLQVVCQHLERIVRTGMVSKRDEEGIYLITKEDLPDLTNIYSAYYEKQINLLPNDLRGAAHHVIEEGLLSVNDDTGEAKRLSVDGQSLVDRFHGKGVTFKMLDTLVDMFLLRREPNSTGGMNYEITHDTLLTPIVKARILNRERAGQAELRRKQEEAERRAQIAETQRNEAERLKKQADRGRRRAVLFSILSLFLLLISLTLAGFSWAQNEKLKEKTEHEERLRKEAEDNFKNYRTEQAEKDYIIYSSLMDRANVLRNRRESACQLVREAEVIFKRHAEMKFDFFVEAETELMEKIREYCGD